LEDIDSYRWKIWKWKNLQWNIFSEDLCYWIYENEILLNCDTNDLVLATWYNIIEILWIDNVRNYKQYWFENLLEFLLSTEVYIENNLSYRNEKKYSFSRNWFETKISASTHGDFRLSQTDLSQYQTVSPFWYQTCIRPELTKYVNWYHSGEIYLLWNILKYAQQIWYKINFNKIQSFIETLPNIWWNFGDIFSQQSDTYDELAIEQAFYSDIKDFSWSHFLHTITTANCEDYFYQLAIKDKNLVIFENNSKNINVNLSPEDIEDFIKWLIYNCANWALRTIKSKIVYALNYYIKNEIEIIKWIV
jgi:hypothetical protein